MGKKGKADLGFLPTVALILACVVLGKMLFAPATQTATSTGAGPAVVKIEGQCGVDSTTFTANLYDYFDRSISVSGNHLIRVGANGWATIAQAGTKTVSPGDRISLGFGDGNATAWRKPVEGYVPCKGTVTASDLCQFAADVGAANCNGKTLGSEAELVKRNGTITTRLFNHDDGLLNSGSNQQAISAGDLKTLYAINGIEPSYKKGGYEYGGCAVIEINTTVFDDIVPTYGGVSKLIGTPAFYTVSAAGFTAKTYEIPPFSTDASGNVVAMSRQLIIDADDTNSAADANDITIRYYPNEYRRDTKTNEYRLMKCGEDETGAQVSGPLYTFAETVSVS
jgi:hypothetical protein